MEFKDRVLLMYVVFGYADLPGDEKSGPRAKGGVGICRGTQPWEGGGTEVF